MLPINSVALCLIRQQMHLCLTNQTNNIKTYLILNNNNAHRYTHNTFKTNVSNYTLYNFNMLTVNVYPNCFILLTKIKNG